jgi:hyperosmotically inducible periplasmic protein
MARLLKTMGVILLASGAASGCAAALLSRASGAPPAAATRPASDADRQLAAAITAKLQARSALQAVRVESRGAAITLTGTVRAAADRAAAERLARGVSGVKSVQNLLTLE